ncbi:MAG TPA: TadE family protein [Candidatus Baltobacteraceae bacterium]|jgi:hypothetical protein|nr:TadE family protein [Candidatus Baltobacteraceae bacterium]
MTIADLRRGSALVETAFTLGFTLMLILGAVQIAVMGFFQMQLDGATFFFAHSFATGSTNVTSLNTALKPLFPNISMNMSPNPQSPPVTNVPVNFTQWGNLNNRYGGASILRPQRLEATSSMNLGFLSVLGKSITLNSGNVDGRSMIGNHDDDAQGVAYDSSAEYTSLVDPLTQDDQNVPPYYITLSFFWNCGDTPPWGPTCSSRVLRAVGLGEYLKDDNYSQTNYPNNGVGPQATFETAACHQRILADLAAAFPATMPTYARSGNYDQNNGPSSVSAWNGASFKLVYSWDIQPVQGETGSAMIGRLYPMAVTNGCGAGQPGA